MEYRSKMELLGLPLIHVSTSKMVEGRFRRGVARGWIAVGDVALGVILAVGGVSIGAVSFGGAAVGILCVGGGALGFMALGGFSIGWLAIGGCAIGAEAALGGLAIAGKVALGGLAIAGQAAAGGEAHAPQVGDAAVRAYFDGHPFFRWGRELARHSRWLLILPILLPLALGWRKLTHRDPPPMG